MRRWGLVVAAAVVLGSGGWMMMTAQGANSPAPATGSIVWADFTNGTAFAMKNNLPVMLSFESSGCPWCKKLNSEVYTAAEVVELSKKFICIKVGAVERKTLEEKYKVTGFPNIVFTNSKGEETMRVPGFMPADGFAKAMKAALEKPTAVDKTGTTDKKTTK